MPCRNPRGLHVEWPDFAVDAGLAQSPGDELGDLATEIQDQHAFGGERGSRSGIRQGIGHVGFRAERDPRPWTMTARRWQAQRAPTRRQEKGVASRDEPVEFKPLISPFCA